MNTPSKLAGGQVAPGLTARPGATVLSPQNRQKRRWAGLLITTCFWIAAARPAAAQQPEASANADSVKLAEEKAAQAFAAYQGRRYSEAVALYIEAYSAAPNADMLYNLARIYDTKLSDRPLAINFYRRYISDPGAIADRVKIASERLGQLREAELAATRQLEPSTRAAPSSESAGVATMPPARGESGSSTAEVVGIIMGATGIVAVGVGAGFGIAAMSEAGTARDLCDGNQCQTQRGVDAAHSASDHATLSTIGFASGSALIALGAAFYFWLAPDRDEPMQASLAGLELGASLSPGGSWSVEAGGSW